MIELDQHLINAVIEQNEARKCWQEHDTPQSVANFLLDELNELEVALQEAQIGGSAFSVASEVGDVLYLYTKLEHISPKPPTVYQAARDYALYVCELTGIDPNDALKLKLFRNSLKYFDYAQNNGYGWDMATKLSRQAWQLMGGDRKFSDMYLEIAETL